MRHDYPTDYRPMAYCRSCGRDFSSDTMFDDHRVGVHEHTFSEGLRQEPSVEDGRRCLDADEMRERGWRPMTDGEMLATKRHKHRAQMGVEIWFDPATVERTRKAFSASSSNAESVSGASA